MRLVVAVSLSVVLSATACTSTQTVEVGVGAEGEVELLADGPADSSPTSKPETTTSTTPSEVQPSPSDYLLTQDDLPGWTYVRPWSFLAEPTFQALDCELMATVWSAHGRDGTRIRASTDDVSVRHTVVQMADSASAEAIVDAADAVWRECNPLSLDTGDEWWVEPIQVPRVEGWRTSGLALGIADDYIWSIAWFQQGSTVVFLDLDSANPWPVLQPVLEATAGRFTGELAPLPAPEPTPPTITTTTPPTTITTDLSPSTTFPPYIDDEWEEHPAAVYVPDPALFGSGYGIDWVDVQEREPSDPGQMIEGCPVDPPPTMDGLRVDLSHRSDSAEGEVLIGIDDAEWAQETVDAFRAVGSCEAEAIDVDEISVVETETGADDAVILEVSVASGSDSLRSLILVARYGDTMIAVYVAVVDSGPVELPSVDDLSRWADSIAAQG